MRIATSSNRRGRTVVELIFTVGIMGVVGLTIYSLLSTGTILGAKNTATNTAHQQARIAMLQMVQDLHSTVSLPQLMDANGNLLAGGGPAAGISFQLWSMGPFQLMADAALGTKVIVVNIPPVNKVPVVGQRLIVPTHEIEDDIASVASSGANNYVITLAHTVPNAITGTQTPTNYNIACFITDRCSYVVNNQQLQWNGPTVRKAFAVLGNGITSNQPFTTPNTAAGALYYRFVSAIDLSTSDLNYNNRGFKSANILLNGQVPIRARLTTYQ